MTYPYTAAELDQALTLICPMCKAKPGMHCVSTISGRPLLRPVHFCRAELSR